MSASSAQHQNFPDHVCVAASLFCFFCLFGLTCSNLPFCLCTQPFSLPPSPPPCSKTPLRSISPALTSSGGQGCGRRSAQTGGTAVLCYSSVLCLGHRLFSVVIFSYASFFLSRLSAWKTVPSKQVWILFLSMCFFFFKQKTKTKLSFAVFAARQSEQESSVCLDLNQQISLNPAFCFGSYLFFCCFFTGFVLTEAECQLPSQTLVVCAFM